MRILFITHYNTMYGANKSLIDLIDGLLLLNDGFKLMLIAPDGPVADEARKRDVEVIVAPFFNEIYAGEKKEPVIISIKKFIKSCNITLRLYLKLRKRGVDIVHTNSSVTFLGAYLSFLFGKAHVWHIREYGIPDYGVRYSFGQKYFDFWIKRASGVISISKAIYEFRLKCLKLKKLDIIYNGVILSSKIAKLPQQFSEDKPFAFGIVGFISKEKGQIDAIRAFALLYQKYKNIKLYIIGEGDRAYVEELLKYVNSRNIGHCVEFTGYQQNVNVFYKKLNVLLMCSKFEALGRVTIEAMANGIVVLGYNNGGTAEIIQDGVNGLLYDSDEAGLADKMEYIFKNPSRITHLSTNALQTVYEKYSIENYSKNVQSFYHSIIKL